MSNFVYLFIWFKKLIFALVIVAALTNKVLAEMPLKNPDLAATNEGYFNFMEIYKTIIGFEDYMVSNLGNVKSLKQGKERILKAATNRKGYKMVALSKDSKLHSKTVHVLVAVAFLGHVQTGTMEVCVDHINNCRTDNRVENLQLLSNRANASKSIVGKTSKLVGVDYRLTRKKWRARILVNNKQISLGHYNTEIEAGNAYQEYLNKISV